MNIESREPKFIVQVGKKKCGKTEYCKQLLKSEYFDRAFIFDIHGEYTEYKELDGDEMIAFLENKHAKGIFRFNCVGKKLRYSAKTCLMIMAKNEGGLLVIENPMLCFEKLPPEFYGLISTRRSKNIDVIVNFTSLKYVVNPKIINNADYFYYYTQVQKLDPYLKALTFLSEWFIKADKMIKDGAKRVLINNVDLQVEDATNFNPTVACGYKIENEYIKDVIRHCKTKQYPCFSNLIKIKNKTKCFKEELKILEQVFSYILHDNLKELIKYTPYQVTVNNLVAKNRWSEGHFVAIDKPDGTLELNLNVEKIKAFPEFPYNKLTWVLFHEFRHKMQIQDNILKSVINYPNWHNLNEFMQKEYNCSKDQIDHVIHELNPAEIDAHIFACQMTEMKFKGTAFDINDETLSSLKSFNADLEFLKLPFSERAFDESQKIEVRNEHSDFMTLQVTEKKFDADIFGIKNSLSRIACHRYSKDESLVVWRIEDMDTSQIRKLVYNIIVFAEQHDIILTSKYFTIDKSYILSGNTFSNAPTKKEDLKNARFVSVESFEASQLFVIRFDADLLVFKSVKKLFDANCFYLEKKYKNILSPDFLNNKTKVAKWNIKGKTDTEIRKLIAVLIDRLNKTGNMPNSYKLTIETNESKKTKKD